MGGGRIAAEAEAEEKEEVEEPGAPTAEAASMLVKSLVVMDNLAALANDFLEISAARPIRIHPATDPLLDEAMIRLATMIDNARIVCINLTAIAAVNKFVSPTASVAELLLARDAAQREVAQP